MTPLPHTHNSRDLYRATMVTEVLDTITIWSLEAWVASSERGDTKGQGKVLMRKCKKQNCSFLLPHFLLYFLNFSLCMLGPAISFVSAGELGMASCDLSSLSHPQFFQLSMESCVPWFSTWAFTCSDRGERRIWVVGTLPAEGEKKGCAPDMQLLHLLQGLLPAKNGFQGVRIVPCRNYCLFLP